MEILKRAIFVLFILTMIFIAVLSVIWLAGKDRRVSVTCEDYKQAFGVSDMPRKCLLEYLGENTK